MDMQLNLFDRPSSLPSHAPRLTVVGRTPEGARQRRPDPVETYLDTVSPNSRATMRGALRTMAEFLCGERDENAVRWEELSFNKVASLHRWLGENRSPSGGNGALSALRGVVRAACRLGLLGPEDRDRLCDVKPFKKRAQPHGRQVAHYEVERLLTLRGDSPAEESRDCFMVGMLAYCGLTREEQASLDFDDADLDGRSLVVRDAKCDAHRLVPIPRPLVGISRAWLAERGDRPGPLFCHISQLGVPTQERLSGRGMAWILRRRVGRTGVGRLSPRDLREYCSTSMLEAGVDPLLVRQLLGHASLDTAPRYDMRHLREAVDAVWPASGADVCFGEAQRPSYGRFEKIA